MKHNLATIRDTLRRPWYGLLALACTALFFGFILWATDFSVLRGNEGTAHVVVYTIINILLAIAFGIYMALFLQRVRGLDKSSVTGMVGTGAGLLVTGCASCTFTFAGLLGLGSLVSLLPFSGLEFNFIGIGLLGYSIKRLSDPQTCGLPVAKKSPSKKRKR